MKKKLYEQTNVVGTTSQGIYLPSEELNILNNILKQGSQSGLTGSELVVLCINNNYPQPIILDGKTYFGGIKTKNNNIILYNGKFAVQAGGPCDYRLINKEIKGDAKSTEPIVLKYKDLLKQFGIDILDSRFNPYNQIAQVSEKLKTAIANGAISYIFPLWNEMLVYFFQDQRPDLKLIAKQGSSLQPSIDTEELNTNYEAKTKFDGVTYANPDRRFAIYFPKYSNVNTTNEDCINILTTYLKTAIEASYGVNTNAEPKDSDKDIIRKCYRQGSYQKMDKIPSVIVKDDGTKTSEQWLKLRKDLQPFGILNKKLSWKEIKDILSGKSDVLTTKAGKNMTNLWIIPNLDIQQTESVSLKRILKESIMKKGEEKSKIITEKTIVRNRLGLVLESNYNKSKNDDKFFLNLLSEMVQLHKQGFSDDIIKENVDNVFSVYSNVSGMESDKVIEMFKQRGVRFIVENLGVEKNETLKSFLKDSLNRTPVKDVPKLFTNCSYLTRKLSESIQEHYLNNLQMEENLGSDFTESIRSTMYEIISDGDFSDRIEPKILGLVCPLIDRMNGIFDNKFNDMKKSLMSARRDVQP
jgi:hypothetical protein